MISKLRFRIILLLCFALLNTCFCIITAGAETHISKRIAELGESYMGIDIDMPTDSPSIVPQMKLERIRFDKTKTKEIIKRYSVIPQRGEEWVCEIGSKLNPDYELRFREENGVYGTIADSLSIPRTPLDEKDKEQCIADATVRAFLDELGIHYEYPFYYVAPLEKKAGGPSLIEIVARLTIDGIPFNTTIGWTRDSDGSGNGDPTPGAFFIVTDNGELTTAIIRNPVSLIKAKDDQTPIKNWNDVLEENKDVIMNARCTGEDAGTILTLKQVEFVMMVDAHQIAYPAWAYYFWVDHPANSHNPEPYSYYLLLTYNARNGREVWRCVN